MKNTDKKKGYQSGKGGSKWPNFALVLLSVLFCTLLIEGGTRLLIYCKFGNQNYGQTKLEYFPHLIFVESLHKVQPVNKENVHAPERNIRELLESNPSPANGKYRILVLGGSTALGLPDNLLKTAFQQYLNRNVEVINLSSSGYIVNQELIMMSLYGVNFSPDLIITLDGANDIVSTTKTGQPGVSTSAKYLMAMAHHPVKNAIATIALRSQFINSTLKLMERKREKSILNDKELTDLNIIQYLQGVRAISLISKGIGAQHIAVLQPYLYLRTKGPEGEKEAFSAKRYEYRHAFMSENMKAINDQVSAFQFSPGHYYVNGTKAFENRPDRCFVDEVHLTPEGYQLLVGFIIDQLTLKGFSQDPAQGPACPQCWPETAVASQQVPQMIF